MAERGSMGRSLLIGGLLGVLVVAVALAAVLLGSADILSSGSEPPADVLVIAITRTAKAQLSQASSSWWTLKAVSLS